MLVLTRKPQEKICIGNDIVITVLRTKGNTVRLGIEAPREMRVLRGEIAFDTPEALPKETPMTLPMTSARLPREASPSQVLHARVSRSEIAKIIPPIAAAGTGPLAAMMHPTTPSGS